MKLLSEFYNKPALELAPLLLGKILCRRHGGEIIRLAITETEAYCGEADTACHAHKGKTPRNRLMYERGGTAYVYLCYGIHHLFNIIASVEGDPQGVLIRGVEGVTGPGRVTKLMKINMSLNGADMTASEEIWLEDAPPVEYTTAPRVGINYADEKDRNAPWRFTKKRRD